MRNTEIPHFAVQRSELRQFAMIGREEVRVTIAIVDQVVPLPLRDTEKAEKPVRRDIAEMSRQLIHRIEAKGPGRFVKSVDQIGVIKAIGILLTSREPPKNLLIGGLYRSKDDAVVAQALQVPGSPDAERPGIALSCIERVFGEYSLAITVIIRILEIIAYAIAQGLRVGREELRILDTR